MWPVWIYFEVYRCVHSLKDANAFIHPPDGYMWIGITGPHENRRSIKVTGVVGTIYFIPDQSARKSGNTAIFGSVTRYKFQG